MDCTSEVKKVQDKTLSWLLKEPPEVQMALLSHHLQLAVLLINELLDDEASSYAGARYSRKKPHNDRYRHWGKNPSSLYIGKEKVPIAVPRVYDRTEQRNVSLERFEQLKNIPRADESFLKSMILGLSTRDHEAVLSTLLGSFGLSKSAVSKSFVEESKKKLEEFENRDLSKYEFIGLFIDGKYAGDEQIVIALGVTLEGDKIPLGFIQSTTENARSIKDQLLSKLIARGLNYKQGLFVAIDGGKGLRKAVEETFGHYAIIQRCQWHKRENVVSYLKKEDEKTYRWKLQDAYDKETYEDARSALLEIHKELQAINESAARSLMEGFEEILTIHRLGLSTTFGRSFSTTNCIENLNGLVGKHTAKIKYWKNSNQRFRWTACALIESEKRMRKIPNHKNLKIFQKAITKEIEQRKKQMEKTE